MDLVFNQNKYRTPCLLLCVLVQLMNKSVAELIAGGKCPEGQPVVPFNLTDGNATSIFDDLTAQEIMNVVNYMKCSCFNVKDFDRATINSTYIALVELMPPRKAEALLFLEGQGPMPQRYAKVVLYRGDVVEPVIEEYRVGPLPNPNNNSKIEHTHWRKPIPYSLRSPKAPGDVLSLKKFLCLELAKIQSILINITGYSYTANCTDQCLTYVATLPGYITKKNTRSLWISLYRRRKGLPLHPIGFQFRVNLQSMEPSGWKVDSVWFRSLTCASMEQLNGIFNDAKVQSALRKYDLNEVHSKEKPERRDPPVEVARSPRLQRGPRSFMPDGRRFSVAGRNVRWFGWSFHFNIRSTTGIQLHDIRFNDERIVYELSLQEILSLYSGSTPASYSSVSMESSNFIGTLSKKLIPGKDCPEHASYFDAVQYTQFRPKRYHNAACLFERSHGISLKRYHRSGMSSHSGVPKTQTISSLVLRTVVATDWYNYILDFVFHENAVLEVIFSVSGSIQPRFYLEPGRNVHGFQVLAHATANIHNRFINFKVDLDINGQENRFETLDIVKERSRTRLGNNGAKQENLYMDYLKRNVEENENNIKFTVGPMSSNYFLFSHVNSSNSLGKPRAYRIVPLTVSKFLLPFGKGIAKSMVWAQSQVAVTVRKDDEDTSSTVYNALDLLEPVLNFQDYNDNEKIIDQDLTAWVTLGSMHIPHAEDIPTVETPGSQMSFILQPFNYFDAESDKVPHSKQHQQKEMNRKTQPLYGQSYFSQIPRNFDCLPMLVNSSR